MSKNLLNVARRYQSRLNADPPTTENDWENSYRELLRVWERVDDPLELRELLDAKLWCDLPMWLMSRTFTRVIRHEGRTPELLENYGAFLAMYCGLAQDVPHLLHREAEARRRCRNDEAEAIFRSLPDFRWGDLAMVHDEAPDVFGPGRVAMVYAEIFRAENIPEAADYGVDIGEWICEVIHHPFDLFRLDGRFVFVPARWLKFGPEWVDVFNS
ncbi:hypothetical protein FRC98_17780 [Lujinxingia vulgaris]|uniref:Uncharacterized protein n=1 Tax=Lujinxingia vulgaris TaxID=2600176 RepID=A0A5C6WZR1_9DELT|nr:hypothetical protein [Lujinxingia vulgaris]TXD34970.1 hypothetical protein FRC98_17780 [Lujinxingia vulgaris]